jgi:hypothetical protein
MASEAVVTFQDTQFKASIDRITSKLFKPRKGRQPIYL